MRQYKEELNYESFSTEDANDNYRGFSSSINGMFVDPEQERVDCCSIACCGTLQADRNRYMVTGVKPPSCFRRFLLHIVLPCWIFGLATYCAVSIHEHWMNEIFSTAFILILLSYFVLQCLKGSLKRKQVRKELLWSKYELFTTGVFRMRHHDEDSTVESFDEHRLYKRSPEYFMGQSMWDIQQAQGICGCYRNDFPEGIKSIEGDDVHFCRKIFKCFSNACCGILLCRQLQVCGMCALAQEGRELETILHPGYHRIDYITMQPMMDYYPAIYEHRYGKSNYSWWGRLSQFSKELIRTSLVVLLCLFGWSLLADRVNHDFRPWNFLVFISTIIQASTVMTFVYWRCTKDISLDALIKFAACGFCLTTTMAIFFELVIGLTVRLVMSITFELSGITKVQSNSYSMSGFHTNFGADIDWSLQASGGSYKGYLEVYGTDHPIMYTFYLAFKSYILAAMVEEVCKYYGFKMVEHPDFLTKTELEEAVRYTYAEDSDNVRQKQSASFPRQDRGFRSRATAITMAMVAVSLGFTCCENLVYIFAYGGMNIGNQIYILVLRSLLPLHPVAAALQSIKVCERELEGKKIGLSGVILPALIFHGTYDFLLLWIEFLSSRNGNYTAGQEAEGAVTWLDFTALGLGFATIAVGFFHFVRLRRRQLSRLSRMDSQTSQNQSGII